MNAMWENACWKAAVQLGHWILILFDEITDSLNIRPT